ncbi:MAG: FAD-binding oxidoreductase [Deltaproteobacteria bacterium]|nr:FAD-binding oxidoreductase [Deltaproteobacteria bacterium]
MKALVSPLGTEIQSLFPDDSGFVADDLYTRRTYSKDLMPRSHILAREGELPEPTIDAVVWPQDSNMLAKFIRAANEKGWELYPYGAGSGVCGGAVPGQNQERKRPRVVVDLKRLDKIEFVDTHSQIAKVQAGIIGQVLEEDLNAKGYTLGHFPSSIYCSSFGGYLATRAAGQLSTYYGKMEDMVLAVEGVLPNGESFTTPVAPRLAVGPDWNHLFLGSEGTLAFLTAAWVKIHKLAEARRFLSFQVESTEKALDGVRQWLQAGLHPAVVRIYDEDESRMLMGLKSGVKLVCVIEGEQTLTDFTALRINQMSMNYTGWNDTGEEPAQHWWSHRYDVSYRQQLIMSHRRMILDTFEVATSWAGLPGLHKEIKAITDEVAKKFPGKGEMLVLLAHFSHFYHCGGNIYFTLCGRTPEDTPTVEFYDGVWDLLLKACERQGAAISHHHGIGRLKAQAHKRQRGVLHDLLKKFKNELDPKHLLNPENLGL